MTAPLSLESIQRWFQSAITNPLGVSGDSLARSGLPAQETGEWESLDSVVTDSRSLSAAERVRIYSNAYWSRLVECLQADFPACRQAVGDEAFAGFVLDYLREIPPQSYTLSELGRRFPAFLESTATILGDSSLDPATKDWSDFVIDLARLERHYAEVFDGEGSEATERLVVDALKEIPSDRWGDVRLGLCPSLRIVPLRFPVHESVTAVRQGRSNPVPLRQETWLAIFREDFVVRRTPLSRVQAALLTALQQAMPLSAAVQSALTMVVDSEAEFSELEDHVADWFFQWTESGWIRKFIVPTAEFHV